MKMDKTEQIIEDCPDFMYGCCQKYLDGDCSAHKCDLKIIRELESKLETAKQGLNLILTVQKDCKKCPNQKLDIDVLVCDLNCETAFKKIAKQTLKTIER